MLVVKRAIQALMEFQEDQGRLGGKQCNRHPINLTKENYLFAGAGAKGYAGFMGAQGQAGGPGGAGGPGAPGKDSFTRTPK